jgi:enamine deaminase RidA (YjgF/YER057c/UK114 family)
MKIDPVLPEGWPRPRGYSNAILVEGASRLLFLAGQIGWDEQERLAEGFLAQWSQALANIARLLEAAGASGENLVRVTVYVTDKRAYTAELEGVGAAWRTHLGRTWPAMSLVQVADLLEEGAVVEVEATAVLP